MILINKICINSFKERSFLKFKLIKSYRRSTMSQKRLSGLTILSIEKKNVRGSFFENPVKAIFIHQITNQQLQMD